LNLTAGLVGVDWSIAAIAVTSTAVIETAGLDDQQERERCGRWHLQSAIA